MLETAKVFGENMEYLRKQKKWTQEELSDRVGLHNSYIGLLERGERIPSLATVENFATIFGIKPADLITPQGKKLDKDLPFLRKAIIQVGKEAPMETLKKVERVLEIIVPEPIIAKPTTGRGKRRKK